MARSDENLVPLTSPVLKKKIVPKQHLTGPPITPVQWLTLYSPAEYEAFIQEWAFDFVEPKYHMVVRNGGAGDKGRDIIGYTGEPSSGLPWDNYQCKHYGGPLAPSDIWVELGKLCFYTFRGDYTKPRMYYFVAPQGVGPTLHGMIENPEQLRSGLLTNWDSKCKRGISNEEVPLSDELREYIESFDFSVVSYKPPLQIIEEHSKTKYHVLRFGAPPLQMPDDIAPPTDIDSQETKYVQELLNAYGQHKGTKFSSHAELVAHPRLNGHFARARESFYRAESLKILSRDASEDRYEYDKLEDEIYRAIVDTVEDDSHPDGFARILSATQIASSVCLLSHVLGIHTGVPHKHGLCHQLVNAEKIKWVQKNQDNEKDGIQ